VEDAIEKLRYDLYYMKHLSFTLDLLILLETLTLVLFGESTQRAQSKFIDENDEVTICNRAKLLKVA
jgi:hypothetical protein